MKDLYIIVEGQTELEFMNRLMIPYWRTQLGYQNNIQPIIVQMSGGGHGFNNIEHFKNTIEPIMNYQNAPFITSFIDYYGINSEKKMPGYKDCQKKANAQERITCLEAKLQEAVQQINEYRFFIPYIQLHEFEALLFSDSEGFAYEAEGIKQVVATVASDFKTPEDINDSYETAPSKRLEEIYRSHKEKFSKVADGNDIAEEIGIGKMMEQCPRFRMWAESIISRLGS
ncbi:MAG: hypothetical protein ACJAWV_001516 [Flammeovirgaceae bacterium]|jgi:hypothetical protein